MSDNNERPGKPGYRNPPKESQFKKGRSGNPRGRPKGSKNLPMMIRQIADTKVEIKIGGVTKRVTGAEAIVMRVLHKGLAGDDKATARFLSLLKQPGIVKTEDAEDQCGVALIEVPCQTHEEWMVRYGSDFRFTVEGIDAFERGVKEMCEHWREELQMRQAYEAECREKYGEQFKGLPKPPSVDPLEMVKPKKKD